MQPHPRVNSLSNPAQASSSSSSFRPSPAPPPTRPAPYMVALSGWPDPVYIQSPADDWEKRRSRPGTPRASFSGEVRDGISPDHFALPSASTSTSRVASGSGGPGAGAAPGPGALPMAPHRTEKDMDTSYRSSPRNTPPNNESLWAYQTSSARSTTPPIRTSSFNDPRLAPNVAVMQNRGALRVAPAWHTSHVQSGAKESRGERGVGWLVMRATPDVYPLPNGNGVGMARIASGGGGSALATEVYPRDPDNGMLWADSPRSPPPPEERQERGDKMEVDQ